ncbi:hypothetical protein HAZT_HAZT006505 [Hyalella azteca]|uniref:Sulfotransferase domain-containing protein n=1 Tax=Hyalella azteca TaxID=294128 RepID=A0A6A0GWZ9_HYAAZ|nr:hypothetical protein HAZT_HAZT006505 [Hyalella azteca]
MSEVCTKIASGHTVHEVDCATKEKIDKLLTGPWADVVLLRPHNWVVLRRFLQIHEKVYNFKAWGFRPDDIVVMTYPKCGTTWSQEIVWNMRNNPDLDNPDADDALFIRSPYLEYAKIKVVYVSRNPKDNVLSAQHHYKLAKLHNFVGTQDEFVDLFVEDLLLYSPYGQHLREAWSRRHHPNFFMTTFEELKADTRQQLTKLDAFLGTGLTDKQFDNILQTTSFRTMQEKDQMQKLNETSYNMDEGNKEGLFVRQVHPTSGPLRVDGPLRDDPSLPLGQTRTQLLDLLRAVFLAWRRLNVGRRFYPSSLLPSAAARPSDQVTIAFLLLMAGIHPHPALTSLTLVASAAIPLIQERDRTRALNPNHPSLPDLNNISAAITTHSRTTWIK